MSMFRVRQYRRGWAVKNSYLTFDGDTAALAKALKAAGQDVYQYEPETLQVNWSIEGGGEGFYIAARPLIDFDLAGLITHLNEVKS